MAAKCDRVFHHHGANQANDGCVVGEDAVHRAVMDGDATALPRIAHAESDGMSTVSNGVKIFFGCCYPAGRAI